MVRLYIRESLRVVFEEWLSTEKQFGVDDVVLHRHILEVARLNFQLARLVNIHIHLGRPLLSIFFVLNSLVPQLSIDVSNASVNELHLLLVIELSVELVELVCNSEEHHPP